MVYVIGGLMAAILFVLAYVVGVKKKVKLLAGYQEEMSTPEKDEKLAKYAGIMLVGAGIIAFFFPVVPEKFFLFLLSGFVLYLLVWIIFINLKAK